MKTKKETPLFLDADFTEVTSLVFDRLKKAREKRNISVLDLHHLSGVSDSHISQLENGKIPRASLLVVIKLAVCLDLPLSELFEGLDNRIDR